MDLLFTVRARMRTENDSNLSSERFVCVDKRVSDIQSKLEMRINNNKKKRLNLRQTSESFYEYHVQIIIQFLEMILVSCWLALPSMHPNIIQTNEIKSINFYSLSLTRSFSSFSHTICSPCSECT